MGLNYVTYSEGVPRPIRRERVRHDERHLIGAKALVVSWCSWYRDWLVSRGAVSGLDDVCGVVGE